MSNGKVLLVCTQKMNAKTGAKSLGEHGLEAVTATSLSEAVDFLKQSRFDALAVESKVGKHSGVAFLAQARKRLPAMVRVLIETEPLAIGMHALVNDVAPAAVFSNQIEADKVAELLRQHHDTAPDGEDNEEVVDHVTEMRKLQMITQISSALTNMMEDPDLVLPVLPEVALRVRDVMANERSSFEAIAEIVETEQGMTARLLQVANSPIYAGLERIKNIQQAVGRLGIRETRNILQAVIAQNLFKTKIKTLDEMMKALWLHSLSTAYSNEVIAQKLEIAESNDYFMMGLLHDVGRLLVIHLVEMGRQEGRWKEEDITEDIILQVMNMRHNDLGARLLELWLYPSQFRDVVRLHDDTGNIERRAEPVIVTHFSNVLTRKVGFSLREYDEDPTLDKTLADALNISAKMRQNFENALRDITEKIKRSCFAD